MILVEFFPKIIGCKADSLIIIRESRHLQHSTVTFCRTCRVDRIGRHWCSWGASPHKSHAWLHRPYTKLSFADPCTGRRTVCQFRCPPARLFWTGHPPDHENRYFFLFEIFGHSPNRMRQNHYVRILRN